MRFRVLIVVLAFIGSAATVSAGSFRRLYNSDPLNLDHILAVRPAVDGSFYVLMSEQVATIAPASAGLTRHAVTPDVKNEFCFENGFQRITILRIDSSGVPVWLKRYGVSGACTIANDLRATSDGGAVVVGDVADLSIPSRRTALAFRIDAGGTVVWSEKLRMGDSATAAIGVKNLSDGGFLLATGVGAAKLDSAGAPLWAQRFIDPDGDITGLPGGLIGAGDVAPTPDGGYVAIVKDFLVRVDGSANLLWAKRQNTGVTPVAVTPTPDGGCLLDGASAQVVHFAADGGIVWGRNILGTRLSISTGFQESSVRSDGSFTLAYSSDTYKLARITPGGDVSALLLPDGFNPRAAASGEAMDIVAGFGPLEGGTNFELLGLDPADAAAACPSTPLTTPPLDTFSSSPETMKVSVVGGALVTVPLAIESACLSVTSSNLCPTIAPMAKRIGSTELSCPTPSTKYRIVAENKTSPGSFPEIKPVSNTGGVIAAFIPLGCRFTLELQDTAATPIASSFDLGTATLTNAQIDPSLYHTSALLEFDASAIKNTATFQAVHLGTQNVVVAPKDSSIPHQIVTVTIVSPMELGSTFHTISDGGASYNLDEIIVAWADRRGIPPQLIKGIMDRETNGDPKHPPFYPKAWRYEPLTTD